MRVSLTLFSVLLALMPLAGLAAECSGRDLLAGGPKADLAAIVAGDPYASGNHWRASRDGAVVHVIGTFHIDEPRLARSMPVLTGVIAEADLLLVEAGPKEMAALQADVLKNPGLMFIQDGPTMPEMLEQPEWERLTAEMGARGIPGFLAAKFQPWYLTVLLGMPVCAVADFSKPPEGLDQKLIDVAEAEGVPVAALEPFDTVFSIFGAFSMADQLEMVRASLPLAGAADDLYATMVETYFRQDHRLIWEFGRAQSLAAGTAPKEEVEAQFATMEEALLTRRNHAWMAVILPKVQPGSTIVVAAGAAHLSGPDGVLSLLSDEGFSLERQPF